MFGSMHNHVDRERRIRVSSMESLKRLGDVLLPDVPVRSLCARHIVGFDAQLTLPWTCDLRSKLQVVCSRHRRHGGRARLRRGRPHKHSLRQQRSGQECAGDARWDKPDASPAHTPAANSTEYCLNLSFSGTCSLCPFWNASLRPCIWATPALGVPAGVGLRGDRPREAAKHGNELSAQCRPCGSLALLRRPLYLIRQLHSSNHTNPACCVMPCGCLTSVCSWVCATRCYGRSALALFVATLYSASRVRVASAASLCSCTTRAPRTQRASMCTEAALPPLAWHHRHRQAPCPLWPRCRLASQLSILPVSILWQTLHLLAPTRTPSTRSDCVLIHPAEEFCLVLYPGAMPTLG